METRESGMGRKCGCDNGKVTGIGCGPKVGCNIVTLDCTRCAGTGWISPQREAVLRAGEELREKRQGLDYSLGEAARALGMRPSDYSFLEFGHHGASVGLIQDTMATLVAHHERVNR